MKNKIVLSDGRIRITTQFMRACHIVKCKAEDIKRDGKPNSPAYYRSIGNLATIHTNQFHNPMTGFLEFYPDTPAWIRRLYKTEHES